MGVSFEKFSFTKITTVASQEINLTGAFQPKALILWTGGNTGTVFQEHMNISFGFSDGTNDAVVSQESEDNAGSALYINVLRNDSIVSIFSETQAELSRANVTSFDADGFTLNWTVNGAGNPAAIIHGIAIGGTDITNVVVDFETAGTTATGNKAYTGAGFQPDFMIAIADWDQYNTTSTSSNNVIIGCAKSTTKRWAIDGNTEGAATMDTWSYHRNDKCMVMLSQTGSVDEEADFVSFDANGFTWNWTNAPGFTTDAIACLLIKGGQWDVGTATQRDNTGSQAITTAGIDTHKGAFFVTHGQVISTAGTAQSHNRLSIGGADGTRQGYATWHDTDAAGTSIISKIQGTDGILRAITAAATATSSTTQAQADFTSFSANTVTINWSVADTTDRIVSWFAVGEAVTGTTYNRSPSADSVTVADSSTTRILSSLRVPSTDSVTVTAGTSTRMLSATRVPSADSTTVADSSLTRSKTWPRVPSTDSTTVADSSTTRLLSALRVPTTETVTPSDSSLTRVLSATRVPSADSTIVSEASLTAARIKQGIPTPDSITISESSLTRVLSALRLPGTETVIPSDSSLTRMLSAFRVASDRVAVGEGEHLFVVHIPLYIYPFHWVPASEWYQISDIMAANPNVLFILKLNVNSGPDTAVNTDYEAGIDILKGQGNDTHIKLLGYVYTSYGARAIADVKTDIDRWQTFYGSDINGIFLDEMESVAGEEAYYQELTNYIHKDKGMEISWGNPGVPVDESYVKANAVDVFQISESADYPTAAAIETATFSGAYSPSKFAMGIHSVTSYNSSLISDFNTDVAYIFVTGDVMPTPYDTVSAYLDDLALQVNSIPKTTRSATRIRAPSADTVTPTDSSLTRLIAAVRSPSADSTTVLDSSVTRMMSLLRTPTTDTISISEDVTGQWTQGEQVIERAPAAENITIADSSLTRLLSASRQPSTDDITIGDNLARLLSASRSPSLDSVATSDNATKSATRTRVPGTDSITVLDSSLTRILSALRIPATETTTVTAGTVTRMLSALRIPTTESVTTSEDIQRLITQPGQFNRSPATENITVGENLTRALQLFRVLDADTTIISENLSGGKVIVRIPGTDSVTVVDSSLTRLLQKTRVLTTENITVVETSLSRLLQLIRVPSTDTTTVTENSLTRSVIRPRVPSADSVTVTAGIATRIVSLARDVQDTTNIIESSLIRLLLALRSPSQDTVTVSELQSLISHSRSLQDTIVVTEPILQRIVTSIRSLGPEFVDVSEEVFFQTWHRFVYDSVAIAEQLFIVRQALSGPVTYAIPSEVRPLLGNIGAQRTDAQIQLAIDSAYDEINRKTNRAPPNDWKDTEADFSIIKKITRYKAALEMSIGIKDFEDRDAMQKEIDEMFSIIEEHDPGGASSNDIVISSEDETYALNPAGLIWSTRYPNLKKSSTSGENNTTINPDT